MFPIAREIWKHSTGLNRLKLLAAASTSTRPLLRPFAMAYLRSVAESGVFWAEYQTATGHTVKASFRLSQMPSDIYILKEVGIGDCYHLPEGYEADVVVDAGGYNGIFALSAHRRWPNARLKIFEPLPENLERIHAHLQANGVTAEVYPYCLGRSRRMQKFFCREADKGSLFGDVPYARTIEVGVAQLSEYLENDLSLHTLIKLDVEGAELEILEDLFQIPRSNIFIVGELHNHKLVSEQFFCDSRESQIYFTLF